MEKVCALIPAYNESKTIVSIIEGVKRFGLQPLVVDDGSTDDTAKLAKESGAFVLTRTVNKGKGASLREGLQHILSMDCDAIVIMDGDGQHNPGDIELFLKKAAQGSSFITGNRMNDTKSMPRIRYFTNKFMSFVISLVCKQRVPDTQCGYKLIKKDALKKLNLSSSHYDIETEFLIEASRAGIRIDSIPVKTIYNKEESYINPVRDTFRFIGLILKQLFRAKNR